MQTDETARPRPRLHWVFPMFLAFGFFWLAVALSKWERTVGYGLLAIRVTGVVAELRDAPPARGRVRWMPVFEYVYEDSVHRGSPSEPVDSLLFVRQEVPIRFHLEQPERVEIDTFESLWALPVVAGSMGLVFALLGLPAVLGHLRDRGLAARGREVEARVTRIEPTLWRVNGRTGFRVVCVATDGTEREFRSRPVFGLRGDLTPGRMARVFVDPAPGSSRYWVST